MANPRPTLTPKQQRFVAEYLVDLNATQAAIRAGYSEKTARAIAHENLTKPDIQEAISAAFSTLQHGTQITANRVLRELARVGFLDVRKLFDADGSLKPVAQWDEDTAAAIASLDSEDIYQGMGEDRRLAGHLRKIRLCSKIEALKLLGQYLALFTQKIAPVTPDGHAPYDGPVAGMLGFVPRLREHLEQRGEGTRRPDDGAERPGQPQP